MNSTSGPVGELELVRRWLVGQLTTSFTSNVPANQPRLLAILTSEFMAYLASIGADPVATFDECHRQEWVGDFVLAYPLANRLRALGPGELVVNMHLPSIKVLGESTTTAANLRRTAPEALLMALARLGVMPGRHRVTVITERVFGRPATQVSPLAAAIEAAGLAGIELQVAQRLDIMPGGVPVKDWTMYVPIGDVGSAISRLKRKLRPHGFVVYQEKKRTKVKPIVRQVQGAKRGV